MNFESQLKERLDQAISKIRETSFYQSIIQGDRVKEIYTAYLYHAYHYVINTASFTPLAARRIGAEHIRVRKWILAHSGEEMGHELMALRDLEILGVDREHVLKGEIPIGVTAWTSFFHYKVAQDNPWSMFGVLYFLEGMAQALAPELLSSITQALAQSEKKATAFFKEHGELDQEHLQEQEKILFSAKLQPAHHRSIIGTLEQAAEIKIFMLDTLMRDLK